ncbi:flagellar hook capping protein [Arcobacter nitrofigilis DSM 7299]|uniref:Basal-body rod modification protein FlgD n=1 Tax=Arcobacter nitrofigilis (strain ATCC 33309 / DSM 7299 / CCUG 15893 / LMG 7604 / NCTC 12251 / CI) TaxID=572480 RepID=D5V677_ARCNC|nr:flagellar hook capping FlgD N-terminal domain-containing protein [Arcobacter nitrofigilis]ADG94147.1 flagellar hook capping protein [Arcobacter nitrofigilis DSM 7299]
MATTEVSSVTDANGQQYTQAISNDKLTNEDFLKLMLEQMKQQDPTKPQDSQNMLNQQMQMSSIQTNLDMSNSMKALQATFQQSSLSNATNLINKIVDTGEVDDNGILKSYAVSGVEIIDGEVYANGNQLLAKGDDGKYQVDPEITRIPYSSILAIH